MNPAVERRVTHFDRDEQHFIEREEYRDLDRNRQAAGDRIDLLFLVELHHRLLLLLAIVGVALLDHGHLRLNRLHLGHRRIGLVGEREEQNFHQYGHDQDREAKIADEMEEIVKRQEHGLGNEIEPTPIDQQIEMIKLKRLVVAAARERKIDANDGNFLGAREQPGVGAAPPA